MKELLFLLSIPWVTHSLLISSLLDRLWA